METKIVYGYNHENKYTKELTLDNTDKAPVTDTWLIPAGYTDKKPPKEKEGFDRYFINNKWEYKEIPAPEPEPELTLEEIKNQKIQELKAKRDTEEVAVISYNNNLFDYDDRSRDRLYIARQALAYNSSNNDNNSNSTYDNNTIIWTTADNKRIALAVEDFDKINAIAAARSNALHIKYNELKGLVNIAGTKEEVNSISWEE